MSTKLKVDELRAQLSQRGLTTTGTKAVLVKRLDAAIRKENKESVNTTDVVLAGKKRLKVSEDEDGVSISDKTNATDKYQDMGIKQLREEAARRGVSAAGSKKELLERLCAEDLEKEVKGIDGENKQSLDDMTDFLAGKKRPRVSEDDGASIANVSAKINAIDKFRDMGIKQLREEAACRGISVTGSKKELLERLCADDDLEIEVKDIDEAKEEIKVEVEDVIKNEKMVVATKKGAAVLDQWLPDHIKLQYHVMQQGDEIYDAMLNQTNVGDNNNKFFVIQVLEADDGSTFMVYFRWGRVGVKGQNNIKGPYTSRDSAIQDFEQKFQEKTKNTWSGRKDFICHPKQYTWLEMDYSDKDSEVQQMLDSAVEIQPRETKLEPRIAKFVSLICNISMMKQQMMEIGYNAEKLPLGKLSKSTILKGYDVLKRLADVIGQADRKNLEQLSGEFYTVIPHDFGFKKMREFVIDTPQKLKFKLEMVEALSEIELATKLLKDDNVTQDDPLYSHYQRLCSELTPVEASSEEFSMVAKYMQNTHAETHLNYTADIVQVFKVHREREADRFRKFSSTNNRMLLWHGSRLTNWTGILSQGLRIAPPEAPVTGYMFGKGVYFADMFSKSANYCYASHATTTGVMLLCEVALGEMAELSTAKYDADKLPEGKLSTKGLGTTAPNMSQAQSLEDGTIVPLGKPKKQSVPQAHLLYNEYIVYNVDQIRMRYVVQLNFNFKH